MSSTVVKSLCFLLSFWCAFAFANSQTTEPISPLVRVPSGRMVAADIARIMNRGELIVALLEGDTPPFVLVKNGVVSGVDIDLMRLVAVELNVPIRFDRSAKTYDEVVQMVASGRADLGVSKLARTLKRAQSVRFSNPYLRLDHALLINRLAFAHLALGQSVPLAVRDFKGSIGVLGGSSYEEFAKRNFPQATVVPYPSWPLLVAAAQKGEVVAAYRDAIEVSTAMKADPSLALTMRTVRFTDLHSSICVVVGPRDNMLLAFVNEVLANQTVPLTVTALLKQIN
jgi:hypothetical protein